MEKLLQEQMFCFQCEQTAGCTGCEHSAGVCGKQASTAQLQDELVGALIALSKTANDKKIKSQGIYKIIIEGLFTTVTNVSFNDETLQLIIDNVRKHTDKISGKNSKENKSDRDLEYDMKNLWKEDEDFDIPFNRQQLADYLNVERAAMSVELSKLQKDGLLTYTKNHFSLNADMLDNE